MTPRLLKVVVQPVYVVEDGEELQEVPVQPVTLSAVDWKTLDTATWAKEGAAAVEAQLGAGNPIPDDTPSVE